MSKTKQTVKKRDFNILLSQQGLINLNTSSVKKESKYKNMGRKRKHKASYSDQKKAA